MKITEVAQLVPGLAVECVERAGFFMTCPTESGVVVRASGKKLEDAIGRLFLNFVAQKNESSVVDNNRE